ncbi:helix-turn-helix transcriptional regulator [Paenibacillus sp. IB182496]|uniref:Helix-turn-helix transcriptional regulator n=1 Tax=Paenibacillus sabuli TaxID=2772509 RepID=A0A927BRM4_9BACL|nr:AraC family transcriptional regulator [Paenibacillus sabuli]MBD2845017.1 helix-turn-helix transcriptional regulator [Paenibacillus sabuli]
MNDSERIAAVYAGSICRVEKVYRVIIQPKSTLRAYRTIKHGWVFPVRGEAHMQVNGTSYALEPGRVLHAAPEMRLDSQVQGEGEFEYYLLLYRLEQASDAAATVCGTHYALRPGVHPGINERLVQLHRQVRRTGELARLKTSALLMDLLHQVLHGCGQAIGGSAPSEQAVTAAAAYIEDHYMEPLTLHGLAALHGMSSARFSYYFHKYMRLRPIEYVMQCRMERARELLQAGTFPISAVSASVGYDNPLYFSRVFKKKFGLSPSKYISQV